MLPLYLIPVLGITVALLIRAEFQEKKLQVYVLKPLSTLLVIAIAAMSLLRSDYNLLYTIGVLIGLVLSLGGDIALMFSENAKAFMIGLVLFLLAHVVYTITFTLINGILNTSWISTLALLVIGAGFYQVLQPGLGDMKDAVIAYMVIISAMVDQALSTFSGSTFSTAQAWLIGLGAVLFYISDMILAANRFWRPWKYHRLSLAAYYGGQLLIALAASYFVA